MKTAVDEYLKAIQKHIPEINTEDVHNLISVVGDLYELIYSRAEAELLTLGSNISKYDSSEQLVNSEFENSKAFDIKEEHQKWLTGVLDKLGTILNYFENLGQTLANKSGFMWNIKVKSAKYFLRWRLGISIYIPKMAEDISIAKKAILNSYQKFENKLIECRYS